MNIGFHHGGIDAQLLAIFQAELDGGLDHSLIDRLHRVRGKPIEGTVESIMLGHAVAVEVGKGAQGIAVVDAFAQFAIIPVLTRMRMSERKVCEGVIPSRPVLGFFSPRTKSWRTCSISVARSSRKVRMPCRRGSRWTPWWRNSRSAKLSWGGARRLMRSSPGAAIRDSTRRCAPRCLSVCGSCAATV